MHKTSAKGSTGSDVGTVVGPSTTLLRNARPNSLAEPPPNVVKNGDIVYALVYYIG